MNNRREMIARSTIKCICADVQRWHDAHGERPGRIFVTTDLRSMLVEYAQEFTFIDRVETVGEYLFGVPLSQYYPIDKGSIAYHLAEKERLVKLCAEDVYG